jgi:hypothetical protein
MASGKSNYLDQKLLNLFFGLGSYSFPPTVYLALFTASPGPGNTGTEVSGSGYSRQALLQSSANWSLSGETVSNVNAISFPFFTGAVGTVVSFGLYDAATGGNLLYWGDIAAPYQKSFSTNDQAVFPAGALTFTES